MVYTQSPGFVPVHSARFATIPSDRRVSTETALGYSSSSGNEAAVRQPW